MNPPRPAAPSLRSVLGLVGPRRRAWAEGWKSSAWTCGAHALSEVHSQFWAPPAVHVRAGVARCGKGLAVGPGAGMH